jgi:hypothetical protein
LVDHLNGVEKAKQFVLAINLEETAISIITRAEILVGVEENQEPLVKALLDQFRFFNLEKPFADLAVSLRRKHDWRLPDAFQATLCHYHRVPFTTRNTKDFDPQEYDTSRI